MGDGDGDGDGDRDELVMVKESSMDRSMAGTPLHVFMVRCSVLLSESVCGFAKGRRHGARATISEDPPCCM